jgi:hypothetical protein
MSRIIKCEHCSVEFEVKRCTQKFCSKKCSDTNWRKENPERIKAFHVKSKEKNKEKNREKSKAFAKKWYHDNPEKAKARKKESIRKNPEAEWKRHRRACYRKLGYPEELLEIKELQYQIKKEIKNQSKG